MSQLVAWFVLFPHRPPQALAWWQRWLRPGYRHCLALREDGPGRSLVIDHAGPQLLVHSLPVEVGMLLREMQAKSTAMALLVVLPPGQGMPPWRPIMTCVEVVKAALGLHAPWIITPAQLATYLRRRHDARAVLPLPI